MDSLLVRVVGADCRCRDQYSTFVPPRGWDQRRNPALEKSLIGEPDDLRNGVPQDKDAVQA